MFGRCEEYMTGKYMSDIIVAEIRCSNRLNMKKAFLE